ncbi:TonB-dependent receptor [uncultured Roseivirga sp.]|uniref:TonB-dependent receptor n=1 Tax=uncultured Roseivirga sp. TaxID=543088 RepID=UPI000D7B2F54|nr:TonB-dependent receptor [uncultured Roseivirga sp.]PWL28612.1 MAG: TonB-dependent receptor [Roseivirga sp. XM-24bin3]
MRHLFFLLTLLVSLPLAAFQSKGNLSGYVTDSKTGESIPGATVQVVELQTGAITDAQGFYTLENLPTETFTIQVSFVGYETQSKFNVVIRSGGNPDVNFELKETVSELGEVVVTANPFLKIEETPLSIQKLSREEIATYPGGNNDIAKVVQSLPGVSGSVGGFRNDIIIRGGAPNENVYYLDGIEIPNINHFATQGSAGGPVGLLNVSFFEGVTLSTSAFAAQYDNALSGVLQFDQRNGNNRDFRTNFRLSSSESALTFEGPLFKGDNEASKTSFIASARRSYLQFLFQAIDLPFLPDYWDYQYKVTHEIDEYNEILVTGVGSIDDFSINVPDEYDPEQQATLDQVPIIKQQTNTIGVSWKRRNKYGKGFSTLSLSNNRLENDFRRFEDNVNQTGLYLQNLSTEAETKFRYNRTRFKGNWTLVSTASLQFVSYDNNSLDLVNSNNFDNRISFTKYGASFQASSASADDRLKYSLGIRVDGNSFTESGNDLSKTISPRFSASYTFDTQKKWSVNASLGRYFKIPPYTILGYTETGSLVNKNAEYIRSDHAVLGLEYLLNPSSRFTLEGFFKKYDNYPVSLSQGVSLANLGGDFSVLGNENISSTGEGRTYGMEFLYQKKFTNNYYAILAYTWYKSEFTGLDGVYRSSAWDSNHLLTFTGGYKFGNNWEISARTRYLGQTPYAPVDQAATLDNYPAIVRDYDRLGTVRLNTFNQTDIRIDKKWNFDKWTFNVFLELQNAFGQDIPNEPEYGLDRDAQGNINTPRQLVLIEDIDNSGILPSLGIVIDF